MLITRIAAPLPALAAGAVIAARADYEHRAIMRGDAWLGTFGSFSLPRGGDAEPEASHGLCREMHEWCILVSLWTDGPTYTRQPAEFGSTLRADREAGEDPPQRCVQRELGLATPSSDRRP